jgi:hypothetical protein
MAAGSYDPLESFRQSSRTCCLGSGLARTDSIMSLEIQIFQRYHGMKNPVLWIHCGSGFQLFYLNAGPDQTLQQCGGSEMFIPDPNFFHIGSRIRIRINPKNCF